MNYKVAVWSVVGTSVMGLIALGLTYSPAIKPLAVRPDASSFPAASAIK